MSHVEAVGTGLALNRLRAATASLHHDLESRFDAIKELTNSLQRAQTITRYERLYGRSYTALRPLLVDIEGLDFEQRGRMWMHARAGKVAEEFQSIKNKYGALGVLYVIEGSTLGGRIILRELLKHGVSDPALAFLDPYGNAAGPLWRGLIAVIEREIAGDHARLDDLCDGAVSGFRFAEDMLCGELV